jgi:hypothetical protein
MVTNNNDTNKNNFALKFNVIDFAIGPILNQGCPDLERLNYTAWLQIFVDPPASRHPPGIWNFGVASKFFEKF